jgi:hypothetical protein
LLVCDGETFGHHPSAIVDGACEGAYSSGHCFVECLSPPLSKGQRDGQSSALFNDVPGAGPAGTAIAGRSAYKVRAHYLNRLDERHSLHRQTETLSIRFSVPKGVSIFVTGISFCHSFLAFLYLADSMVECLYDLFSILGAWNYQWHLGGTVASNCGSLDAIRCGIN